MPQKTGPNPDRWELSPRTRHGIAVATPIVTSILVVCFRVAKFFEQEGELQTITRAISDKINERCHEVEDKAPRLFSRKAQMDAIQGKQREAIASAYQTNCLTEALDEQSEGRRGEILEEYLILPEQIKKTEDNASWCYRNSQQRATEWVNLKMEVLDRAYPDIVGLTPDQYDILKLNAENGCRSDGPSTYDWYKSWDETTTRDLVDVVLWGSSHHLNHDIKEWGSALQGLQ